MTRAGTGQGRRLADDSVAAAVGDGAGDHRRAFLDACAARPCCRPGWARKCAPGPRAASSTRRTSNPCARPRRWARCWPPRWTCATARATRSASASRTSAATSCTGWSAYLNTLGTIAAAGPLLGLFGTVVGMIQMFLGILDHGIGDVNQLAGGIGKALVCTATGMIVAIPALMFHRYFRGRIAELHRRHGARGDPAAGRARSAPGVPRSASRPARRGITPPVGRRAEALRDAHPRPPRGRRAGDQPDPADRRRPVPDHLLRRHHHLRRALGAEAGAAAAPTASRPKRSPRR